MLASLNVTSSSSSSVRDGHFGVGKRILIARELDLVAFDALGLPRHRLHPVRLRLVAGRERVCVPGVVEVLGRHDAEEEDVVRLAGQRQPMPLDLLRRQILHREILIDQVQHVALLAFDRDRDEAQLGGPVVVFGRMQAVQVVDVADLQDRQRGQQRLDAADGGRVLRPELLREARLHDLECWFGHFILQVCASRSVNRPSLAGSTDTLAMMRMATSAGMARPSLRDVGCRRPDGGQSGAGSRHG